MKAGDTVYLKDGRQVTIVNFSRQRRLAGKWLVRQVTGSQAEFYVGLNDLSQHKPEKVASVGQLLADEMVSIRSQEAAEEKANQLGWTVIGSARIDNQGCGIIIATKVKDVHGVPYTEWVTWRYHPVSLLSCGNYTSDGKAAWGDFYQRHAEANTLNVRQTV